MTVFIVSSLYQDSDGHPIVLEPQIYEHYKDAKNALEKEFEEAKKFGFSEYMDSELKDDRLTIYYEDDTLQIMKIFVRKIGD